MRKYQISINLHIVDENTKPTSARNLCVYADGNDLWGVVCGGFQKLITALAETGGRRPIAFGCCEHEWK